MNVGEGGCACFWLEPTGTVRLSIRRFTHGLTTAGGAWEQPYRQHRACSAEPVTTYESGEKYQGGCDASVDLDIEIPLRWRSEPGGYQVMLEVPRSKRIAVADPRWPKVCEKCGQSFVRTDVRQWNQAECYIRGDTGEKVAFRGYADKGLAGGLFDAWWLHGHKRVKGGVTYGFVGPDGIALVAICPNGLAWEVDGPSSNGTGWTRSGDPRTPGTLSATPSIIAGDYHGWLGVNGTPPGHFSGHLG